MVAVEPTQRFAAEPPGHGRDVVDVGFVHHRGDRGVGKRTLIRQVLASIGDRVDAHWIALRPELEQEADVARAFAEAVGWRRSDRFEGLGRRTRGKGAAAARAREKTALKGRALFHPIRVAITAAESGPELDLSIPAIDRAAALPPGSGIPPIVACRERARLVAGVLGP